MSERRSLMGGEPEEPYAWEAGSWAFKLDETGEIVEPAGNLVGEFVKSDDTSTYKWRLMIQKSQFNPNGTYGLPYLLRHRINGIWRAIYRDNTRTITYTSNPGGADSINSNAGSNGGTHYYFMTAQEEKPEPGFVEYTAGDPGYGSVGFTVG